MWVRGIKLSVGAAMAILIAYFLGLNNPLTAGTIALLSLGKTKRSSVQSATIRVKSVIIALVIASGTFFLADFTIYAFIIFLCLYVGVILIFKLDEGLLIGTVLSGQIWVRGSLEYTVLINVGLLFVIGVCVAFLFNLYMPDLSKSIKTDQRYIETTFRDILLIIATVLRGDSNFDATIFAKVETFINKAIVLAETNEDNYFFSDVSYHGKYIRMRKRQFFILKHMFELADQIDMTLDVGEGVAQLVEKMAFALSESGTGEEMLKELADFREACKRGDLPKSRGEFENRAILFQILSEMRHLTELKREFADQFDRSR